MALDKFQPYLFVSAGEQSNKLLTPTYSGGIASFQAQRAQQLTKLLVQITPVQSGTGDPSPSNIRPISGRTGMTVTRCGKNILNLDGYVRASSNGLTFTQDATDKNVINVSGTVTASWATISNGAFPCQLVSGRTYTLSVGASGAYRVYVRVRNADGTTPAYTTQTGGTTVTWTQTQDADAITELSLASMTSGTAINTTLRLMVEDGASATTYAPYVGTTYPITWETEAGTIYGGTLDVVSGVLTVDKGFAKFSDKTWTVAASRFYCEITDTKEPQTQGLDFVCSAFARANVSDYAIMPDNTAMLCPRNFSATRKLFVIRADAYTSASDFLTAMGDQTLVYPLATPQTYQLTPTEVLTIAGYNQIYADTGAVLDVEF